MLKALLKTRNSSTFTNPLLTIPYQLKLIPNYQINITQTPKHKAACTLSTSDMRSDKFPASFGTVHTSGHPQLWGTLRIDSQAIFIGGYRGTDMGECGTWMS